MSKIKIHYGDLELDMTIAEGIQKIISEKNITMYKLAKETGLGQSTISNLIHHKSMPSVYTLECICQRFNLKLSDFFKMIEGKEKLDCEEVPEEYHILTKEQKQYRKTIGTAPEHNDHDPLLSVP